MATSRMDGSEESKKAGVVVKLKPIDATPSTFKDYGQVIEPSSEEEFGPGDAQLDLSRGIPRLYIMHTENCPLVFSNITHHANVTQCLGSVGGHVWYLGVAKPTLVDDDQTNDRNDVLKSRTGHLYLPPAVEDVQVFRVQGSKFLKLNRGTWHAGPLYKGDAMDFYNLELSNTNEVDHTSHDFCVKNNVVFSIDE